MAIAGSQSTSRKVMKSASTKRKMKKTSRKRKASSILGKLGAAYVPPSKTTMAGAEGPFSTSKFTTFLYENALAKVNPGSNFWGISVISTGMFDYDVNNYLGNKQPLYFDQLLSATGPYKSYKVISWKTTFTFVNEGTTPVNIWVAPALTSFGEVDSAVEADNFPGVKKLYLTSPSGSQNKGNLVITGHIDDVWKGITSDSGFIGSYAANPSVPVYTTICAQAADGVANAIVYIAVKHEAYTELLNVDAIVS